MTTTHTTQTIAFLTLLLGAFFCFPQFIDAQQNATTDSINITTESRFHGPNESVTVMLSSTLINLNDAEVTWTKNGQNIVSGTGKTETQVTTGSVGESIEVGVQAQIPGSGSVQRSIEISPVDIDMVWESTDSFVPAFYEGKALHPGWGPVKVTVIPHIPQNNNSGDQYNASDLVYNWQFNNLVYGDDSGRGKNTFMFDGTPRTNRVSVEIETPSGDPVASKTTVIPTVEPQIELYPITRDRGITLAEPLLTSSEINLEGEGVSVQPFYYLAESSQAGNLSYDWLINNQRIENSNKSRLMRSNDILTDGSNDINLEINDTSHLLFPSKDISTSISL